jgi:translation initiation factor IF-1
MPVDDLIEFDGVVSDALGGGQYSIVLNNQGSGEPTTIRAKLAGKLRLHRIRVIPGDDVVVRVSPYDLTHGIITYRGKSRSR